MLMVDERDLELSNTFAQCNIVVGLLFVLNAFLLGHYKELEVALGKNFWARSGQGKPHNP